MSDAEHSPQRAYKDLPFEQRLEGRRIKEFFIRNASKYDLTDEDFNIIEALYKEGSLKTFDDVVHRARVRADQRKISFMEAVFTVVADRKNLKVVSTSDKRIPLWQRYGYVKSEIPSPETLNPSVTEEKQIDLTGLDQLLNRLGWRSDVGLKGDMAEPNIPKGSGHREANFQRALTGPDAPKKESQS